MNYKILITVLLAAFTMLVPGMALADPITAVVSVASIASGSAAWATATGFAAFAAGAQIAGGALSLLGAIAGNEKLVKIGGIAQLVGGVGTLADKFMTPALTAKEASAAANASLMDKLNAVDAANTGAGTVSNLPVAGGAITPVTGGATIPDIKVAAINSRTGQEPGLLARANTFFKDNADTIKTIGSGVSGMFDQKNDLYDAQAEQAKANAEHARSSIGQSERDKAAISASLNGVYVPASMWATGQPTPSMPIGNTVAAPQNPLRFIQRPLIRRI